MKPYDTEKTIKNVNGNVNYLNNVFFWLDFCWRWEPRMSHMVVWLYYKLFILVVGIVCKISLNFFDKSMDFLREYMTWCSFAKISKRYEKYSKFKKWYQHYKNAWKDFLLIIQKIGIIFSLETNWRNNFVYTKMSNDERKWRKLCFMSTRGLCMVFKKP